MIQKNSNVWKTKCGSFDKICTKVKVLVVWVWDLEALMGGLVLVLVLVLVGVTAALVLALVGETLVALEGVTTTNLSEIVDQCHLTRLILAKT
jgi:hypothetical protein